MFTGEPRATDIDSVTPVEASMRMFTISVCGSPAAGTSLSAVLVGGEVANGSVGEANSTNVESLGAIVEFVSDVVHDEIVTAAPRIHIGNILGRSDQVSIEPSCHRHSRHEWHVRRFPDRGGELTRSSLNEFMKISFWGAAGTVTGSRFVVETDMSRILVDCGQFQGDRALRRRNWEPFPVDPSSIDAVVLTHAHIDHSGFLPALVRDGFQGPIWSSRATKDLCELLLRDSAMLQEEEAYYANKHKSSRHDPALPLFTIRDAERALDQFQSRMFDHEFPVTDDITATFHRVGHILGASYVVIEDGSTSILFSGDVGRPNDVIMRAPEPPVAADVIVVESTYGDRIHPTEDPSTHVAAIANETLERSGILLIPTFAVGRAQMILHLLAELRWANKIPDVPIYLNSPMAIDATELMLAYASEHHLSPDECRRISDGVIFTSSVDESIELTRAQGPMIILSASGMATGGRVLHHLRQVLPQTQSTILFVGHQAAGTRGQLLVDGATTVRIFGQDFDVACQVKHISSLSAHADRNELIAWLKETPRPPRLVYIVHGEPSAAQALNDDIVTNLGWSTSIAEHGRTVETS